MLPKVNIVIPMAGRGSRFANNGFQKPKPLIDVAGKPMITWVLDNIDSALIDATFILLVLKEQEEKYNLIAQLQGLKPNMKFVLVDQVTEGAACTALLAQEHINNNDPLFIANSDQFVEWDSDKYWGDRIMANKQGIDGDILCFHIPLAENDTKWSYAALNSDGYVTHVREKEVISENATVGMYYWHHGCDFVQSAQSMIDADARVNGEFYVAPAYNVGVDQFHHKYTVSFCNKMWGLGVPADLVSFLNKYVRSNLPVVPTDCKNSRASGPLRFIAHRGNTNGPNPSQENNPSYIAAALSDGFDVEVDAWLDECTGQWRLGHDEPQYSVDFKFFLNERLWVHCKNGAAFRVLAADPRVNCFFHDIDDYTLTSHAYIWAYPDKTPLGPKCIAVMYSNPHRLLAQDIGGICHDNVGELRAAYVAMRNSPSSATIGPGSVDRISLILFDLDGVLVESRDLHYEALNMALSDVAGPEHIISRTEHELIYDGLSTNQKLKMLEKAKGLNAAMHHDVWMRKQELTTELVRTLLKPSEHITKCIKSLKQAGFAVGVASNCIRSSVYLILEVIGVLEHIDVCLSNEDCINAKPDPDIYRKACDCFCVAPNEVLVVEDSTKGWEAASRASCHLMKVSSPADVTFDNVTKRVRELETLTEKVTVVVPLAGPYHPIWLRDVASEMPVYVADAAGRPALSWIMDSLKSDRFLLNYVFVVKSDPASVFGIESICAAAIDYKPFHIVNIMESTLGSAASILACPPEYIPPNSPLLIADGHSVPEWCPGESLDTLLSCPSDGGLTVVDSKDQRWSYVRLVPDDTSRVAQVHMERQPVSNLACSGLYYFQKASSFLEAAKKMIAQEERSRGWYYCAPTMNDLISHGKIVQAMRLKGFWSLRSMSEVAEFEKLYVPIVANAELTKVYQEMTTRQVKTVAEDGLKCDSSLLQKEDPRRCLAAYILCTDKNFTPFQPLVEYMTKLEDLLGSVDHCLYRPLSLNPNDEQQQAITSATLHFTFMQLISFHVYGKVEIPDNYNQIVEAVLRRQLSTFKIYFSKIVVTPSNVLVVGYPSADVNTARSELRRVLKRCGLPLFEPYNNNIVHMTLVRFASPISTKVQLELQNISNEVSSTYSPLGVMDVGKLMLSPASWKMQPTELGMDSSHEILLEN